MKRLLAWLLSNAVAIAVAAWLLDGISFDGPTEPFGSEVQEKILPLLLVSAILGLVSVTVEPVVKLLSLPFILLTIGLFLLVINALMLLLVEWVAEPGRHRVPRRRLLERARRLDHHHPRHRLHRRRRPR